MDFRSLLLLILALAFVGFVVYLVVTKIAMPDVFKQVIVAIVVFALLYWLISTYGGYMHLPAPAPRRS